MNVDEEQTPEGYIVCRPTGELDAFTVSQFRQALGKLVARPRLIIDLGAVPFVDSAGLGALIGGIRRVRELGGEVVVSCDRPSLVRTLKTTGFDRLVTMTATVKEARAQLALTGQPAPGETNRRVPVEQSPIAVPIRTSAPTILLTTCIET